MTGSDTKSNAENAENAEIAEQYFSAGLAVSAVIVVPDDTPCW